MEYFSNHCLTHHHRPRKEYGFVFPSSEIYDGLSATYDYGPYGVELKKQHPRYWWEAMVQAQREHRGHRRGHLHAPHRGRPAATWTPSTTR
jgi:hypothetical protein